MLISNNMTDQWTKVSQKKKKKNNSKKMYVPPVMKKAPKSYPEMKNPNLWREIKQFKEKELTNNNIYNLYIRGELYDNQLNRLNNIVSEQFNNNRMNELNIKLKKCMDTINKFKRINSKNEDIALDLLKELKNVYEQFKIELKNIHFEDKFYKGQVYNITGNIYYESDVIWNEKRELYLINQKNKKKQWDKILESSKINNNKTFSDLFK